MPGKRGYLLAYNVVQLCLWTAVLVRCLVSTSSVGLEHVYEAVAAIALTAQTLAWAEVVHAMLGFGGTVPTAVVQCLGRFVVLMLVVDRIDDIQGHIVTLFLLMAWSVGDIVRYAFYIAIITHRVPKVLLWMRYSLFLVLYPLGIVAEWLIYYRTLPFVDKHRLYAIALPNKFNFAFDFGVWNRIVLVLYLYFGPFMFSHMLSQRRKKLHSDVQQ
ncbi:Very-long-chain (3R)-3-hydroxyacyl-CoA dehydratase 2 [Gracilariopsis chorda]|uniref:very-long-chain (3R)-3-hydroxyacyl-CoA dehydratase n=1 Tax=Gracilariopsis chorda TaxID=448386 RepID=A0A2V3ISN4_9FLOR|nr:Very-long-chain (3R)-3-hydroxyacyl-CoA dehydratase 2 [Gracilariopsis chorda]|eukprot:PXF45136.1 Very-long-chain (3R)-3-hydroxyacyl-CoA dehydratase 2 [Gracilariopsis chorda]